MLGSWRFSVHGYWESPRDKRDESESSMPGFWDGALIQMPIVDLGSRSKLSIAVFPPSQLNLASCWSNMRSQAATSQLLMIRSCRLNPQFMVDTFWSPLMCCKVPIFLPCPSLSPKSVVHIPSQMFISTGQMDTFPTRPCPDLLCFLSNLSSLVLWAAWHKSCEEWIMISEKELHPKNSHFSMSICHHHVIRKLTSTPVFLYFAKTWR